MNPQPSWTELAKYYNAEYEAYDSDHGQQINEDADVENARCAGGYRHIKVVPGARILDVGSGGGLFLRVVSRLGAIAKGVEPSSIAADQSQRAGLDVFNGTLEQFSETTTERFDIITANHVVEHVPSPIETLTAMRKLLAPGGLILISVPNGAYPINQATKGRWHSTDLPYHLMQFTPSSMALAGTRAGLSVQQQRTESLPFAVAASIGLYLRHRWLVPRRLRPEPLIWWAATWYGARQDSRNNGEAIITEFVA